MTIKNIEQNISNLKKKKNTDKEKVKKTDLKIQQQKNTLFDKKEKRKKRLKHLKNQQEFFNY